MGWPFGVIVIMVLAGGCVSGSYNLATERLDYTITSTTKEVELGRKIALKVEAQLPLVADEAVQARVRRIGQRIAAVCDRQDLVYSFAVVEHESLNAFSLPGGYIYLHTGLIEQTKNDDELAGVIAHEVGHVTALHAIKRYEGRLGTQLLQLASLVAGQSAATQGLRVALASTQLAYARQDELEADRLAVKYLRAAAFDPTAMLTFLETLSEDSDRPQRYMPAGIVRPQYALTHPFVPERKRVVKEALYNVADYMDYINSQQ